MTAEIVEEVWPRCTAGQHRQCPMLHFGYGEWDAQTAYICGCSCHKPGSPGDPMTRNPTPSEQAGREVARFAEWQAERHPDAQVHWYFGTDLCEEYVMGDAVIDHDRSAVTCGECVEWMHA